jgi:hypothetical protein
LTERAGRHGRVGRGRQADAGRLLDPPGGLRAADPGVPEDRRRPVNQAAAAGAGFPEPSGLFTIKDLGGWPDVNKKFFDKDAGIVAEIERKVGVSVGS